MFFFCKLTFLGRVWDPKGPFSPGFEFQCVCGFGVRKASYGLSIGASPASTSPTSQKKSSDSDGSGLVILLLVVGLRAIIEPTSESRTKVGPTRWRSKPAGQELGGQLVPSIALAVSRRSTHAKRNDGKNKKKNSQCKVLAIGGGRGGTSDVCSGDGRSGRYHTDGRMKRRHILVQVCVHLANLMQATFVGSALSSKRLSWNFEDFILGGGPPECYFGRWPPAYYSRTPLPTVKKEQEILRAKFANPASPSSDPPLPSAPSQPTQP